MLRAAGDSLQTYLPPATRMVAGVAPVYPGWIAGREVSHPMQSEEDSMFTITRLCALVVAGSTLLLVAGCQHAVKHAPAPTPATAAPMVQKSHVNLSADALFAFGKSNLASLSANGHDQLEQLTGKLRSARQVESVDVIGYTDRIGSDVYNEKLSQQRADTVRDYLVAHGIAADAIKAEGRGKADPVVDCPKLHGKKLRACLAPNRRVEVNITAEN